MLLYIQKGGVFMRLIRWLCSLSLLLPVCFSKSSTTFQNNPLRKESHHDIGTIDEESFDVLDSLSKQINEYRKMSDETPDDERIARLIDATDSMIRSYAEEANSDDVNLTSDALVVVPKPGEKTVTAAIAWFYANGYKLSGELLTFASINESEKTVYKPLYGGRIVTSSVVQDISRGSITSGDINFNYSDDISENERDLALSLHSASYTKPDSASTVVTISDTYDFSTDTDQDTGILQQLNNLFASFQSSGTITKFDVHIEADLSKVIDLRLVGKDSDGKWIVNVKNNTGAKRRIVYNKKMCNLEDGRLWKNLTEISYFYKSNGYSGTYYIEGNGTADAITFSFIEGNKRYITTAYGLSETAPLSIELTTTKITSYSNIEIIGKCTNFWWIEFQNIYSSDGILEYNSKMCNYSDAESWANLRDIKYVTVRKSDSHPVSIYENGTADAIAMRFKVNGYYRYIYAKDLSADCTMSLKRRNELAYDYLVLKNNGKTNGKWNIRISNPTSSLIQVSYNTKMCFDDDAKNWSNLSDIAYVTISAQSYASVSISPNFFATSVVASYVTNNGKRLITYANGLTDSGGIVIMNSKI